MTVCKRKKRPRDANQLAKFIVDVATGEEDDAIEESKLSKHGRLGGEKGGSARAEKLSPLRRSEIAKEAADARWEVKNASKE